MSQIYNNSTKRPKPKENQLGILEVSSMEFMYFAGNSAQGLGSRREHFWHHVSLRIHPKSCRIFPLKLAATVLSGSGKGEIGA